MYLVVFQTSCQAIQIQPCLLKKIFCPIDSILPRECVSTAEELAFRKGLLCARHLSHRISINLHNHHKRQLSLSHFKDEAIEVGQIKQLSQSHSACECELQVCPNSKVYVFVTMPTCLWKRRFI